MFKPVWMGDMWWSLHAVQNSGVTWLYDMDGLTLGNTGLSVGQVVRKQRKILVLYNQSSVSPDYGRRVWTSLW